MMSCMVAIILKIMWLREQQDETLQRLYREALTYFEKDYCYSQNSETFIGLADYYIKLGEIQKASVASKTAVFLAKQAGNLSQQCWAVLLTSEVSDQQGHYKLAISQVQEALHLARAAGDLFLEAKCLQHEGGCCLSFGNFQHAAILCAKAMALNESLGFSLSAGSCRDCMNIQAEIYLR